MTPDPRDIFTKARRDGYAIGAFNAANLETIKAIVQAAVNFKSPVIIESSPGETNFIGAENLVGIVANYRAQYRVPILVNLDHALSETETDVGINAGYDLIHIDASKLPHEENIALTKRVVEKVKKFETLVEGEIDHIGGSSQLHDQNVASAQNQGHYTDPDQAAEYAKQTQVDTLATFVGNVHGLYQNSTKTLDVPRLQQIAAKVDCFLSLHGGSGVPDEQIRLVIKAGIVKINVNTELRLAYKTALLQVLQESEELAIYKIMPPVIAAVQKVVEEKIKLFGSAGKV